MAYSISDIPKELKGQSLDYDALLELGVRLTPMIVKQSELEFDGDVVCIANQPGIKDWITLKGIKASFISHLTDDDIELALKGTTFIGDLPLDMVAKIYDQHREMKFVFLDVRIPAELKGVELSAEQMDKLGAKLVGYKVATYGYYAIAACGIFKGGGYTRKGQLRLTFDCAEQDIPRLLHGMYMDSISGVGRINVPEDF